MKVAILTLRLHINYGGILQAYALMSTLKRLGHEPWLIFNQPFKYRTWYSKLGLLFVNSFRKFVLQENQLEIFRERRIRREFETIYVNTLRFVDEHIQPHTDIVCSQKEWKRLQQKYNFDAFIVGSDQVWRPSYAKPISRYFLSFLKKNKNVKRISYAASFGIDEWTFTIKQTKDCKQLLQLFDAVSVREKSGVELCKTHFEIDAIHLLDPTMLLNSKEYLDLLHSKKQDIRAGVLVYVLDQSAWKEALVKKVETVLELSSFRVNNVNSENVQNVMEDRIAPPVENWLAGFTSAQFVITDSFHACVFSILFHVPFWVCGNKIRGLARIRSLLGLFDLGDRLVDEFYDASKLEQNSSIDWNIVDQKLNVLRIHSVDFLKSNLK